jgi:peptidoglycan/xylan/chitin deacetylase (PgdA/CDA1 family)
MLVTLVFFASVCLASPLSISTDSTCSSTVLCPGSQCCSIYNFCGSTDAYCAVGNCGSQCTTTNTTTPTNTTTVISTDGTCGGNVICPNNECCSQYNFCGFTADHCGVGCQSQCDASNQLVTFYSCNKPKQVVLTFDDGPFSYTTQLLLILSLQRVKATFFMVGKNIEENKKIATAVFKNGHTIGSHSYSHPDLVTLTPEQIKVELNKTDIIIKSIIGRSPKYFRPPYSSYNINVDKVAKSFGYKTIMVGLDTQDWLFPDSTTIVITNVKKHLNQTMSTPGGPIICQHDRLKNSVKQVNSMINYIKQQGYSIVSLDDCLA